jgi:protein-disulfide isomerase
MVTIKKKTVKRFLMLLVVVVFVYTLFYLFTGPDYPDINTPKPVFGDVTSPIEVIEYSDLECPACKSAHPVVKQMKERFADDIRFEYYHFPLRSIHPFAQKAAEAVECAHDQGMFWEYIDAAFAVSPELSKKNLKNIAGSLGLDRERFDACLDSGAKKKVVEGDLRKGGAAHIQGTPTFFVNGHVVPYTQLMSKLSELTGK